MTIETILHSGSFNDYDGNIIKVTFFKKTDLNVSPTSLEFYASGGVKNISVWSKNGQAEIAQPNVGWLYLDPPTEETIPGSSYYKYTYRVNCATGTGSPRSTTLTASIEGISGITLDIEVIQTME